MEDWRIGELERKVNALEDDLAHAESRLDERMREVARELYEELGAIRQLIILLHGLTCSSCKWYRPGGYCERHGTTVHPKDLPCKSYEPK